LRDYEDAYGHQVYDFLKGKDASEIVERDDSFFDVSAGAEYYFAKYGKWHSREKRAMRFVKGRVLDIGCGAGRVSLHLQRKGFDVLGVDISPLAVRVCKIRGLRKAKVIPITRLSSRFGMFDTLIMFGNNFGLFGNPERARWLLKRFRNMTTEHARIIAESIDPYKTNDPAHHSYQAFNKRRGRMPGQIRIRVRYRKYVTPWFDYLLVSRREMEHILRGTGWEVRKTLDSKSGAYIAIIEKSNRLGFGL
jgi:SAM-dependent methyltransferase